MYSLGQRWPGVDLWTFWLSQVDEEIEDRLGKFMFAKNHQRPFLTNWWALSFESSYPCLDNVKFGKPGILIHYWNMNLTNTISIICWNKSINVPVMLCCNLCNPKLQWSWVLLHICKTTYNLFMGFDNGINICMYNRGLSSSLCDTLLLFLG